MSNHEKKSTQRTPEGHEIPIPSKYGGVRGPGEGRQAPETLPSTASPLEEEALGISRRVRRDDSSATRTRLDSPDTEPRIRSSSPFISGAIWAGHHAPVDSLPLRHCRIEEYQTERSTLTSCRSEGNNTHQRLRHRT
jgi:hypothetical protein